MKIKIVTYKATGTIAALTIALIFLVTAVQAQDGEQLFKQCKACHTIGQGKLLGPDLIDISKKRDAAWLKSFIKSSQTMIKNGDPQAIAIFEEFNKIPMLDYNLPDADIDAMIAGIRQPLHPVGLPRLEVGVDVRRVRIHAPKQAGARGNTDRRGDEAVGERHAFAH